MKKLKNLKIKYFFVFVIIMIIYNSCLKKEIKFAEQFKKNLTNDSVGYWNYFPDEFTYGKKSKVMQTFGFHKNGTLEFYRMRYGIETIKEGDRYIFKTDSIGKRMFVRLDGVARPPGFKTNKWNISKDSILSIMSVYDYKVVKYSKDSVVMKLVSYYRRPFEDSIKRFHIFHRVKGTNLDLDQESKMLKDSLNRSKR